MMKSWMVAGLCFAAGFGLGAAVFLGKEPAVTPEPGPAPVETPAVTPRYAEAPPMEPDTTLTAASVPTGPARELEALAEAPTGGRPTWWNDREGPVPPVELRTNREAMQAWMAEQRVEQARQARTNFLAQARLSEPETIRFDVLMAALNMRLRERTAVWREALDQGSLSRAEVRARAMAEISQSVVLTYDELDRNMPEGWRTAAGTNFNLMTFVEPEVWRELRPLMRGGFRGGPPPGRALNRKRIDGISNRWKNLPRIFPTIGTFPYGCASRPSRRASRSCSRCCNARFSARKAWMAARATPSASTAVMPSGRSPTPKAAWKSSA